MLRRRLIRAAVMVAGLLEPVHPLDSSSRLVISVAPRVARAPATVRVRVDVEPATANRSVNVVVQSVGYYASTHVSLNGEAGPRVNAVAFQGVPAGAYKVSAILSAGSEQVASSEESIEILGR